jgi:hypothetical protein
LVFLASAIPKLRHPKGFILTVLEYRVLPPALGQLYARLLPPLELPLALLLVTGAAVQSAAIVTSLLLISFVPGAGVNLARGRDLDCGCVGGRGNRRIGPGLPAQDLGLLGVSVALVALGGGWLTLASWSVARAGGLSSGPAPVALLACAVAALACEMALPRWRAQGRRWKRVTVGR